MSFLTPLFLLGLAGLAIPVVLHLIQRERKQVVQFPSLMFLRRIPYQSVQRRRIRNWLLLMMRLAALALIVLAFARPFLDRAEVGAAGAGGAREVVILLDRSYSMGYGDRWDRALSAARDAINGIRPSDRASIVLFASGAELALRSTADRGRLGAAVESLEPGAGSTRLGPALKLAGSLLSESGLPRKEAILISDFQRNAWQGSDGVRLPDGAVLTPVAVTDASWANLAVTPIALQRGLFQNQERVTVTAGVVNHGEAPVSGAGLSLEIGGRPIQTQRIDVAAHGSASVTFEPMTVADANVRSTVRLGDDGLARDNAFHFVLSPERPIRVLIADRSSAGRDTSLYLARSLSVGESPRFEVSSKPADSLSNDDVSRGGVIIVNDAPVSQTTADRLKRFVEGGGGLFVILGERAAWPASADVLPGVPGAPVDRSSGEAARLGALEYGHPVFEIFRAPRSGDFSSMRFYGYRAVTPAPGAEIVARFDDGGAALLERKAGLGRVLMWTSTVDLYWNDFAVKPVYVPFIHRIVRHLAAYQPGRLWRNVGEVLDPPAVPPKGAPKQTATSRVVLTPSGQRVALDEEGPEVLELAEQGFYEIRAQGRDDDAPVVVAANVALSESDLTPMDSKDVVAAATGRAGGTADGSAAPLTDEAQEGSQRIWWYLLFAGVLLLGAETIMANRLTV